MDEKINELKECHNRWQDITINQFGYVNNWLISIGIAFLAFAFDKESFARISVSRNSELDLNIVSVICIVISIACGLLTSISRLYDFRITRHITITKQRFYKSYKRNLDNDDFSKPTFCEKIEAIILILFKDLDFLTRSESKMISEQPELRKRITNLRKTSNTLGIITWNFLRIEILFLLMSILFYTFHLLH